MDCAVSGVGIFQAITQAASLVVASTTYSVTAQDEGNRSRETAPSRAREPELGCPLHCKAPDPSASNRKSSQHRGWPLG